MATIFGNKRNQEHPVKHAVAEWVWENVIQPDRNPRLIVDAGTSAQAVADVIAEQVNALDDDAIADEADFSWLTVLTHNLGAWEALRRLRGGLDLFLVGGRYDRRLNANIDPGTIAETLEDYNPSVVVIAASGLDADGLYCSSVQDERPVKEALAMRKTTTRVIVADHTKIGRTDVRCFAALEDLKNDARRVVIVTDEVDVKSLPEDQAAEYQTAINAFRQAFGKDSVVLVSAKGGNGRAGANRGKKNQPQPATPTMAGAVNDPPKREAM